MLVLLTFGGGGGGVVQNRESPDFRSPEVGRYALVTERVDLASLASLPSCFLEQSEKHSEK